MGPVLNISIGKLSVKVDLICLLVSVLMLWNLSLTSKQSERVFSGTTLIVSIAAALAARSGFRNLLNVASSWEDNSPSLIFLAV